MSQHNPIPLDYRPQEPQPAKTPFWWRRAIGLASWLMVLTGLGLFARALVLPAYLGGFNNDTAESPGFVCLLFGFPFWPSNALLLLSPLMRGLAGVNRGVWLFMAILYSLSTAVVLYVPWHDPRHCLVGTYYWASAHLLITLAVWVALPRGRKKASRSRRYYT